MIYIIINTIWNKRLKLFLKTFWNKKVIKSMEIKKNTPSGRFTIIKTLLIPKLNHLILTLPNPSSEIMIFNFYELIKRIKKRKLKLHKIKAMGVSRWLIMIIFIARKAISINRIIRADTKWVNLLESILKNNILEI